MSEKGRKAAWSIKDLRARFEKAAKMLDTGAVDCSRATDGVTFPSEASKENLQAIIEGRSPQYAGFEPPTDPMSQLF